MTFISTRGEDCKPFTADKRPTAGMKCLLFSLLTSLSQGLHTAVSSMPLPKSGHST